MPKELAVAQTLNAHEGSSAACDPQETIELP